MADPRMKRGWTTPTDLGPKTAIRPRLTKRGIGGVKAVMANPVSWTVDPVFGCIPWLTLNGGQDAASQAARQEMLLGQLGAGDGDPGAYVNNAPSPPAGTPGATPGTTPTTTPTPTTPTPAKPKGVTPGSGPFAYITASKTGR